MTTCFHHQDRETGRACTRCGRPACPDCLTQAAVGSQCFECIRAGRPKGTVRIRQTMRRDPLIATKVIIGINVVAFLLIGLRDGSFGGNGHTSADLALSSQSLAGGDWWRIFSYSVVHYGFLHIFLNMLVLAMIGRVLEPGTGPVRFATLYVVSVLGGAAGALIASPLVQTGGASGGVFGLAAAATLILNRQGIKFWDTGFGPLIVINLVIDYFIPGISLGGHVGGVIAGGLAAEAMMRARRMGQPALGYVAAAVIGVAAIALTYATANSAIH